MDRKRLVLLLAFIFIFIGFANLIDFFLPFILTPKAPTLNLLEIVVGACFFRAGGYLLNFDEFGRKFTLVILLINAVSYTLSIILILFFHPDKLSFYLNFFGWRYFNFSGSHDLVVLFCLGWIFFVLMIVRFLLQAETRALFSHRP